jgi:hypothetical protein
MIEALGRLGVDVDRASSAGTTPLGIATQKGHAAAAEALPVRRLGPRRLPG